MNDQKTIRESRRNATAETTARSEWIQQAFRLFSPLA
jgi:hypothetical protein